MDPRFKDPLFIAFTLYLGKVLYLGMSLHESIFMSALIGIQVYREYLAHVAKIKQVEVESDLSKRVAASERKVVELEAKVNEATQAVFGLSLVNKRPR
jgi:hypothetical protein